MAYTTCLVCLVSTVSCCSKNALVRGSTCSRHMTKLEQSTLIRYVWFSHKSDYIIIFYYSGLTN
jgi:hypothetical protein